MRRRFLLLLILLLLPLLPTLPAGGVPHKKYLIWLSPLCDIWYMMIRCTALGTDGTLFFYKFLLIAFLLSLRFRVTLHFRCVAIPLRYIRFRCVPYIVSLPETTKTKNNHTFFTTHNQHSPSYITHITTLPSVGSLTFPSIFLWSHTTHTPRIQTYWYIEVCPLS